MKVIYIIWDDWKQMKTDETTVTAFKKKSLNIYFENNEKWWKYHLAPPDKTCRVYVPKDSRGILEQLYSATTLSS